MYLSWDLWISLFERLFEMWLVRVMTTFFLRSLLLPALSSLEISHIHVFSDYFNADPDYVVAQAPWRLMSQTFCPWVLERWKASSHANKFYNSIKMESPLRSLIAFSAFSQNAAGTRNGRWQRTEIESKKRSLQNLMQCTSELRLRAVASVNYFTFHS